MTLQETAKTCSNEVSHLRKRRRELEAKNAELRYDMIGRRQCRVIGSIRNPYNICVVVLWEVVFLLLFCGPCRTLARYPSPLILLPPETC